MHIALRCDGFFLHDRGNIAIEGSRKSELYTAFIELKQRYRNQGVCPRTSYDKS